MHRIANYINITNAYKYGVIMKSMAANIKRIEEDTHSVRRRTLFSRFKDAWKRTAGRSARMLAVLSLAAGVTFSVSCGGNGSASGSRDAEVSESYESDAGTFSENGQESYENESSEKQYTDEHYNPKNWLRPDLVDDYIDMANAGDRAAECDSGSYCDFKKMIDAICTENFDGIETYGVEGYDMKFVAITRGSAIELLVGEGSAPTVTMGNLYLSSGRYVIKTKISKPLGMYDTKNFPIPGTYSDNNDHYAVGCQIGSIGEGHFNPDVFEGKYYANIAVIDKALFEEFKARY